MYLPFFGIHEVPSALTVIGGAIVLSAIVIDGEPVEFDEGERWHTQNSYKYSAEEFRELAGSCGFSRVDYWTDANDLMGVQLFRS